MPSQNTINGILAFVERFKEIDAHALGEVFEIARLQRLVYQAIENNLAGWGLGERQLEIMEILYHNKEEALTPAELSDEVYVTRPTITSALDSLEKLGYTVRRPHPKDRRKIVVFLTPSGQEFISEILPERYQMLCRIGNSLSKNERAVVIESNRKILDFLLNGTKERADEF